MDAVTTDPVADAVTVDAKMVADVTMDVVFPSETAPVDATFSGSSFSFVHAAATALAATTDVAMETVTAAGSSLSFCSFAAA